MNYFVKLISLLLLLNLFVSKSNAELIEPTISLAIGTFSRTVTTILVPTNSWSSPITIPLSPVSSPIAMSSFASGILFGDVSPGITSSIPDASMRTLSAPIFIPSALSGSMMGPTISNAFGINLTRIKDRIIAILQEVFSPLKPLEPEDNNY